MTVLYTDSNLEDTGTLEAQLQAGEQGYCREWLSLNVHGAHLTTLQACYELLTRHDVYPGAAVWCTRTYAGRGLIWVLSERR